MFTVFSFLSMFLQWKTLGISFSKQHSVLMVACSPSIVAKGSEATVEFVIINLAGADRWYADDPNIPVVNILVKDRMDKVAPLTPLGLKDIETPTHALSRTATREDSFGPFSVRSFRYNISDYYNLVGNERYFIQGSIKLHDDNRGRPLNDDVSFSVLSIATKK